MLCSSSQISRVFLLASAAITLSLSGCGGGGGSSSQATAPVTNPVTTTPTGIDSPMGCGTVTSTGTGNVTPLVVDGFPCAAAGTAGSVNFPEQPYISVQICAPGSPPPGSVSANCQIIDHILVDTGSTGLRIADSALSTALKAGLTAFTNGSNSTSVSECEQYVSSYVWGPVVNVDVYIAGKSSKSTQMQIFGNSNNPVPNSCSTPLGGSTLTQTDTVTSFGGNGLLGVSFSLLDYSWYFDCPTSGSSACTQNNFAGLPNIVYNFASDNNGVTITLPKVGASGSLTPVVGTLAFGVSTGHSNNTPTSTLFTLLNDGNPNDYTYATFQAEVGGVWTSAYIDSGTDVAYFNDQSNSNLTQCSNTDFTGLYCPAAAQSVIFNYANFTTGVPTSQGAFTLQVANPALFNSNVIAFNNVAGPVSTITNASSDIALGLVTFFGHTNYILFTEQQIPGAGFGSQSPITGPMNGIN